MLTMQKATPVANLKRREHPTILVNVRLDESVVKLLRSFTLISGKRQWQVVQDSLVSHIKEQIPQIKPDELDMLELIRTIKNEEFDDAGKDLL